MNSSEYIQLGILVVAGLSALVASINIFITSKSVKEQKRQWEFSNKPVFKINDFLISSSPVLENGNWVGRNLKLKLLIENQNRAYFQENEVTFTDQDVPILVEHYNNGDHEGLKITMETMLMYNETRSGFIQIKGVDMIDNPFISRTKDIKLSIEENKGLADIQLTYLTCIK